LSHFWVFGEMGWPAAHFDRLKPGIDGPLHEPEVARQIGQLDAKGRPARTGYDPAVVKLSAQGVIGLPGESDLINAF
jgi:hypothetical protein